MNDVLRLVAGSRSNPVCATVEFEGTLTPSVALAAATRAFGHANGVTVTHSRSGISYRCSRGKARRISTAEDEMTAWMSDPANDQYR